MANKTKLNYKNVLPHFVFVFDENLTSGRLSTAYSQNLCYVYSATRKGKVSSSMKPTNFISKMLLYSQYLAVG